MKKFLFITLLLLLCLDVVVQAAPLPLVPGVTSTTQTTAQTQQEKTEKTTAPTSQTTSKTEEKKPSDDKDTQVISQNKGGDDPAKALEDRLNRWFEVSEKDEPVTDKIAFALESTGADYRTKAAGGVSHLKSALKAVGDFGADSYRAATDVLFGWDYRYLAK